MSPRSSLPDDLLPSELPDDVPGAVVLDWETSGLYKDSGAYIGCAGVAFRYGDRDHAFAWPFRQGLYGKPEIETARFGYEEGEEIYGYYKNDSKATGAKAGDPKRRKTKRKLTAQEVLEPDPNLGPDEWAAFTRWLLKQDIAAHNLLFEIVMADAGCGPDMPGVDILPNGIWCTMLGQHLLDPQHPKGLKETGDRLWGETPDEQERLREHLGSRGLPKVRYDLADWSVIKPYLLQDVRLGLRLARLQYLRFRGGEAKMARMQSFMRDLDCLVRQERRGVPYNRVESLRWAEKIEAEADQLERRLPFRPTDNGARQFYFTTDVLEDGTHCLGLKPIRMTAPSKTHPKGQAGLDAEVVDLLAQRDVPHARTFYQLRQLRDAAGRYYRGYAEAVGDDGRLRTRYRQVGTKPGRVSCERVNLQAIPQDHRLLASGAAILAEAPSPRALVDFELEGLEGWHMDLAQAELRVASEYAQCQTMWDLVASGQDAHGVTAINLGLATGPDDPGWYKARSVIAKRSNFSLIFGVAHVTFRADLRKQSGVDLEKPNHICVGGSVKGCKRTNCAVKKLIEDWHDLYPEFRPAIDTHMRIAEREHRIRVRDDYYRYFTQVEIQYRDFHKAFNNRVQGNIGLFTKAWMVEVDDLLMSRGIPVNIGLVLQIHDALLLALPPGMRALAEECAEIGRQMWKEWFQIPGGVDVEPWKKEKAA